MKRGIETFGYLLGFFMFVVLVPGIMWLMSGRPVLLPELSAAWVAGTALALVGLALAVWTIIYMKKVGKGNPMDPFDHQVAPRTQHLMTCGPYAICRNPMLLGTYLYHIGILIILCSWQALAVWIVFVAIMTVQMLSEEKRLERDFPDEYGEYKKKVGRFTPRPIGQGFIVGSMKFWTLFIGIAAVCGAMMMWIDPTGKMWGMEPLLPMLQSKMPWPKIFFRNFIPSGFALFFVNGLTQLIAYLLLRKKHQLGSVAVLLCGVILMLWIVLEWWVFGFSWLPNLYFVFGVLEVLMAGYGMKMLQV